MKKSKTTKEQKSLINEMMLFEDGQLSEIDTIKLFSELVQTGIAWRLQGFYGRNAVCLIENEIIDKKGNILVDFNDYLW
jgi:hypothetical protein